MMKSEIADIIAAAALPLPPSPRASFTAQVVARLRAYPVEAIGASAPDLRRRAAPLSKGGSAGGRRYRHRRQIRPPGCAAGSESKVSAVRISW
jgi:hypothetical protein